MEISKSKTAISVQSKSMNVSTLAYSKKRQVNHKDFVEMDPLCWYDLRNYLNTYYPDLHVSFIKEAAEAFCLRWPGWGKTYGLTKIEKAIEQRFS